MCAPHLPSLKVYAHLWPSDLDALADRLHDAKLAADADQVRTNGQLIKLVRLVRRPKMLSDLRLKVVPPAGFEPATVGFQDRCIGGYRSDPKISIYLRVRHRSCLSESG
jgi:hypothetical protein